MRKANETREWISLKCESYHSRVICENLNMQLAMSQILSLPDQSSTRVDHQLVAADLCIQLNTVYNIRLTQRIQLNQDVATKVPLNSRGADPAFRYRLKDTVKNEIKIGFVVGNTLADIGLRVKILRVNYGSLYS